MCVCVCVCVWCGYACIQRSIYTLGREDLFFIQEFFVREVSMHCPLIMYVCMSVYAHAHGKVHVYRTTPTKSRHLTKQWGTLQHDGTEETC